MGAWDSSINGNDAFLDIYNNFFAAYNEGFSPQNATKQILENFEEEFNDYEDGNNYLFGLALAQWETKSLSFSVLEKVRAIINTGKDLALWKELEADEQTIEERKIVLNNFLQQISVEKENAKRRVRVKYDFKTVDLIRILAPDGKKTFYASEHFTNGIYEQTGSGISWGSGHGVGGGSAFYFIGQGKFVSARWIDGQTLEITHDKEIVFIKKEEQISHYQDSVKLNYVPK